MSRRTLADLPATYQRMGKAALWSENPTVRESTQAFVNIVGANGGKFHIRGRSGKPVPLTAMGDTRIFAGKTVGRVRGIPEGFWHIVEQGRGGGYLVASRSSRAGGRRRGGQAGLFRTFESAESFGGLKPIRTPMGPRQFARPGPHGPIGHPWAASMKQGVGVVSEINTRNRVTALVGAFAD